MITLVSPHHFFTRNFIRDSFFCLLLILVIRCGFSDSQLAEPPTHLGQKSVFLLWILTVSSFFGGKFKICVIWLFIFVLIRRWAWTAFLLNCVTTIKLLWFFFRRLFPITGLLASWAGCIGANRMPWQGLFLRCLFSRLAQLIRRVVRHGFTRNATLLCKRVFLVFTMWMWRNITSNWIQIRGLWISEGRNLSFIFIRQHYSSKLGRDK